MAKKEKIKKETKDPVFDPFPGDPAIVAMGRSDAKQQNFNPEVSPFTPFTPISDLGSWKVVAAEYTGENGDGDYCDCDCDELCIISYDEL